MSEVNGGVVRRGVLLRRAAEQRLCEAKDEWDAEKKDALARGGVEQWGISGGMRRVALEQWRRIGARSGVAIKDDSMGLEVKDEREAEEQDALSRGGLEQRRRSGTKSGMATEDDSVGFEEKDEREAEEQNGLSRGGAEKKRRIGAKSGVVLEGDSVGFEEKDEREAEEQDAQPGGGAEKKCRIGGGCAWRARQEWSERTGWQWLRPGAWRSGGVTQRPELRTRRWP